MADSSWLTSLQDAFEAEVAAKLAGGTAEEDIVDALSPAFEAVRRETMPMFLAELRRDAPKMLRERRRMTSGFETRNFRRWKAAFDELEMLIVMVEEICATLDGALRPQASEENDYRFEALAHLAPRAILVAREILHLLRGGYPDAALSRWRTLYELSVVSHFLLQNNSDIALRYLASFDFRALRSAREYNEHATKANLDPFSVEEIAEIQDRASRVEQQIGGRLKYDYDWAHPALLERYTTLKPDRVNFTHLEQSVKMDHWRPRFRWANQHIHAGFRPHASLLGTSESVKSVALVGPINSGFVDPFQMCAISLAHVASTFLMMRPSLDSVVYADLLQKVSDDIAHIAIKLEESTMEAHRRASPSQF